VPYDLPDACVAAYYPEVNPLIPLGYHDELSKTPAYKGVPVRVAAPLLAAALPRKATGAPALHLALSTAALWLWHLPAAYDLALSNTAVYWVMQATLFVPALLFWRAVMAEDVPATGAVLLVTGAYVQMALLGALLTFAPVPLYALHQTAPFAWGMTPLSDQQLAGLIMWVPGGLPYAVAGAALARRGWMRSLGA
jgi:putative membrane protein